MRLAGVTAGGTAGVLEMENFQVDVILNSLKDLQQEKLRNEKVLVEVYSKRKQLEGKLATVVAKHSTTSERNDKLREAMKVAEQKVAQTQAQVKMFDQVTDEKRLRIVELNHRIAEEEKRMEDQLVDFESKMTTLTDRFRSGWYHYSQKSLEAQLAQCVEHKQVFLAKAAAREGRLHELGVLVQQLRLKQQETQNREVIPRETWEEVVEMFRAENEAAKVALEQSKQVFRVEELQEKRKRLTEQLEDLEGQLSAPCEKTGSHEE